MMRWIFVAVWIGGLVSAVLAVAAVPERNASGIVNIQQLSPNAVDQTRLEREAERF